MPRITGDKDRTACTVHFFKEFINIRFLKIITDSASSYLMFIVRCDGIAACHINIWIWPR
eukprot:6171910-Pleurochrysis_carterae.AAC.3